MATYNSNVWNSKAASFHQGSGFIAGKLVIPDGTAVATGDVLNFFKLRANQVLVSLYLENNAWGSDVPGTLGHYEANDNDGDGTDGEVIDADSVLTDLVFETAARRVRFNGGDLTSTGGGDAVAGEFNANFAPVTGDLTIKAVVGTVSSGTSAGEKYVRFVAQVADCGSSPNVAYTWNGNASGSASYGV